MREERLGQNATTWGQAGEETLRKVAEEQQPRKQEESQESRW